MAHCMGETDDLDRVQKLKKKERETREIDSNLSAAWLGRSGRDGNNYSVGKREKKHLSPEAIYLLIRFSYVYIKVAIPENEIKWKWSSLLVDIYSRTHSSTKFLGKKI